MKIFLVYVQSPEQVRSFNRLKKAIENRPGIHLFFITHFKLQGQSEFSQIQYVKNLERLIGPNTFIVPEYIMSKLHPIFLKFTFFSKRLCFVIGNLSEFYGRTIYEELEGCEIIVVDDGADMISASTAVSIENIHTNLTFFSKYEEFINPEYRNLQYAHPTQDTVIHQNISSNILGVLGGPYVELEALDLGEYENLILEIMTKLGCNQVYYLMHRRESKKFTNPQIQECIHEEYSSIELLDHLKKLPACYWTFTSSALLDIYLKYGGSSGLKFFYSKPIFPRKVPRFFLERGIDSNQNLLKLFRNCGFHEILIDFRK